MHRNSFRLSHCKLKTIVSMTRKQGENGYSLLNIRIRDDESCNSEPNPIWIRQ